METNYIIGIYNEMLQGIETTNKAKAEIAKIQRDNKMVNAIGDIFAQLVWDMEKDSYTNDEVSNILSELEKTIYHVIEFTE